MSLKKRVDKIPGMKDRNRQIEILKSLTEEKIEDAIILLEKRIEKGQKELKLDIEAGECFTQEMMLNQFKIYKEKLETKVDHFEVICEKLQTLVNAHIVENKKSETMRKESTNEITKNVVDSLIANQELLLDSAEPQTPNFENKKDRITPDRKTTETILKQMVKNAVVTATKKGLLFEEPKLLTFQEKLEQRKAESKRQIETDPVKEAFKPVFQRC
jgi:hypothetical protein